MHRRIADDFMVFILRNESRVAVICEAGGNVFANAFLCGLSGFRFQMFEPADLPDYTGYLFGILHLHISYLDIHIRLAKGGRAPWKCPALFPSYFSFFRGTIPPANSPITLTNSVFAGTTIFVLFCREV